MSAKIIIIGLFSIALVEGLGFGADCANKHSNCNAGLGCNQYLDANNNAKYICSTTCTVANEVAQCGKAGTCLAFNDADKIARNICDIASRKSVCPVVPCSSGTCNTLTLTCTGTGVVVTTKGPVVVNPGCGDLANNCAQLKAGGYCTHASYIALM
uniref:ShKT domain-containing protein n=1 Tax=Rhabditophanes sp. KR3021 TaxID=114890 RepID=A0AC35U3G4_9BILA